MNTTPAVKPLVVSFSEDERLNSMFQSCAGAYFMDESMRGVLDELAQCLPGVTGSPKLPLLVKSKQLYHHAQSQVVGVFALCG